MWENGNHCKESNININDELLKLEGELDDTEAQISFAKFLRYNPSFACQLLFGVDLYEIQDVILRTLWQRDFALTILSRGFGKCENKDNLILTNEGLVKMIDVNVGDYVQSKNGANKVLGKTINPEDTCYKVTTRLGFSSEGLDYHRVLTLNKNLEEEWKYSKDLVAGDVLILRKNSDLLLEQYDIFNDWVDTTSSTIKSNKLIICPNYNKWYYFFGLLIGDGHIRKNFTSITSKDEEVISFLKEFCLENNLRFCVSKKQNTSALSFVIHSASLINFLEFVGFDISKKAFQKEIPLKLTRASEDNIGYLLRGLFDTDGYCGAISKPSKEANGAIIGFCSSSELLIKQVRVLLLALGIVSSTRVCFKGGLSRFGEKYYKCNKAWEIIITSAQNIFQFKEKIGFNILRKANNLNKIDNYKFKNFEFSNYIPYIGGYLQEKYNKKTIILNNIKLNFRKNTSIRLAKLLVQHSLLDDTDKQKITNLINPNYVFDTVKSVEQTSAVTVDIQVANEECYVSDGIISHNSFVAGLFVGLYAIFNPGVKIGIASKSFRQSKIIFKNLEDLTKTAKGSFLKQCIAKINHGSDAWEMQFKNNSRVVCIPLGDGGKIRGYRFDVMVIDELLLLSDQTINEVIRPFLVVNSDPKMKLNIEKAIQVLKQNGEISEEDIKTITPAGKKLIGLTSAAYKFEYLYALYQNYIDSIRSKYDPESEKKISHAIFQLSYKAAPEGLMNKSQIDEARATMSAAQFSRELESQFTDDSSGFFSAQKMKLATIPDGQQPCTRITGDPNKKYILSIDPNYSDNEGSDHFAMALTELNEESKSGVLVHAYATAKSNIAARARYVAYLFKHFNIVFVIVDNAGGTKFVGDINESEELKSMGINLKFMIEPSFATGDYFEELKKARNEYNLTNHKICYAQLFNEGQWIRTANEHLQACIENQKIMFASSPTENDYYLQLKSKIGIQDLDYDSEMPDDLTQKLNEFIEHQQYLINLTKTECALIEVVTSPQGKQTFDLPRNLKGSSGPDKARKDSYSALLLNNWGIKCYFDFTHLEAKKKDPFIPINFS